MASRSAASVLAGAALLFACSSAGSGSSKVEILTADGFRLAGRLAGRGPNAAVIVPAPGAGRDSTGKLASSLQKAGWRVLVFDPRGQGGSEGRPDAELADRDAAAAIRFLRQRSGAARLAVVGVGAGGAAALVAAEREEVAAVVAVAAPVKLGMLDAGAAVGRVHASKLFVAGHRGRPASDAEDLYNRAADPRKLVLVGETNEDLVEGRDSPEARKEILSFLADAAG